MKRVKNIHPQMKRVERLEAEALRKAGRLDTEYVPTPRGVQAWSAPGFERGPNSEFARRTLAKI